MSRDDAIEELRQRIEQLEQRRQQDLEEVMEEMAHLASRLDDLRSVPERRRREEPQIENALDSVMGQRID